MTKLSTIFAALSIAFISTGCATDIDDANGELGLATDFSAAGAEGGDAGEDGGMVDENEGLVPGFEPYTPEVCGDGSLTDNEECDDGRNNGSDKACTASCTINICGDGLVYADGEECDNGRLNGTETVENGVICSADCTIVAPE